MAKKSSVFAIEVVHAGKILCVMFYRKTDKPYLLGRKAIVNSYQLTDESSLRLHKILAESSLAYSVLSTIRYKVAELEEMDVQVNE